MCVCVCGGGGGSLFCDLVPCVNSSFVVALADSFAMIVFLLSNGCLLYVSFPCSVVGDYGISGSYSFDFKN